MKVLIIGFFVSEFSGETFSCSRDFDTNDVENDKEKIKDALLTQSKCAVGELDTILVVENSQDVNKKGPDVVAHWTAFD